MTKSDMEELLIFGHQIPFDEAQFEQMPLRIAQRFLECFDSDGCHTRQVPRYVMEAMAKRFRLVFEGDAMHLDQAFGGRVRWQRNRIADEKRMYEVAWRMSEAMKAKEREPHSKRGKGTPFEIALEQVGEDMGMSPDNVHRLYKKAGSR